MKIKLLFIVLLVATSTKGQQIYFVSPDGKDSAEGTFIHPLKHINNALDNGVKSDSSEVYIYLRKGTYSLNSPLQINGKDWNNKKLMISAYKKEQVIINGSQALSLKWEKDKNGIWKSKTNVHKGDQLFVQGQKRINARYPNFVEHAILSGTAADVLTPARINKWETPKGGFIHALHEREWGDMHYVITGKDANGLHYTGGHQNNRPSAMHNQYRFVENIYEELDSPGEWFLNKETGYLFYHPYPKEKIKNELFQLSEIPHLIELKGIGNYTISNVSIKGIQFTQTSQTFMEHYERLLRSDWAIYRGAAILIDNAKQCVIENCEFTNLGGNAIFISRYADSCVIKSNYIHQIGASAICIVGDTSAVRSGVFNYEKYIPYAQLDKIPGPKNELYSRHCIIEDNLIHDIGQIEKQVAGVQIQIAKEISVRHNTIYRTPRAAINLGDGSFGGHIIEYNDAFSTVLETSDHGAFNSWGRDRFWQPSYEKMSRTLAEHPELALLDALYTTSIRYNRLRCDHGWDIDLDDGSSNYHIHGNICLSGGIKLREGFNRIVENNIVINNTLHPHLWFNNCGDIVRKNIFTQAYLPIQLQSYGEMIDSNFFSSEEALLFVQKEGTDAHSLHGTLAFVNYKSYNLALPKGSKAFDIGFENIPQNSFGVYSPHLKRKAEKPELPELFVSDTTNLGKTYLWLKAKVRMIHSLGDRSAYGLPGEKGILLLDIKMAKHLQNAELKENDVIYAINGDEIDSIESLRRLTNKYKWQKTLLLDCFRDQQKRTVQLLLEQ
ncbi:MAG: PDZ domain-containing protein [Bacteroidaceae bacterium]